MADLKFIDVVRSPTPEILDLLTNNIIGTPGHGMLYQHLGVHHKIDRIAQPYYLNLSKRNRLIGTCCFCSRSTANVGSSLRSFYVRYFSFRNSFRRKSISERSLPRHSLLKDEVNNILDGQFLDVNPPGKFFHYAYVDPRNIRSLTLCNQFGFQTVRKYTTVIFNRISPAEAHRQKVTEVPPSQVQEIKQLLSSFYKDYTMFSFDNLFNGSKYHVIRDSGGRVVAGAQANPDRWNIVSLPGLSGKVILNTFTHLPYLNRLFNKDYRFLTIEGIYYEKGYEQYLEPLFESLLARYQLNSALMVVDPDTHLYKTLRSLKLGWVDKLNKEVRGNVICRFTNLSEQEKQVFRANPAYISGIDVT
jgi:hypothetical protein